MASDPKDDLPPVFERVIPNAYHGTDVRRAQNILKEGFRKGRSPSLFLGDGVYFYEGCYDSALDWAARQGRIPPAVLRSVISLGLCIDMTTKFFSRRFYSFYEELRIKFASKPSTKPLADRLTETTVMNLLANEIAADSVRAEFHKNLKLFQGSKFSVDSHLVICVRNIEKILSSTLETPRVAAD